MLLTTVLAFLHVLTAMGWLGGGIVFGFVVAPRIAKLSPVATREFFVTIVPGVVRFFQAVAGATIVFGLLLLFNMTNGDASMFSFSTTWGRAVDLGMATALVAFVVSEAAVAPAYHRVIRAFESMSPTSPPTPSPQIPALLGAARGWSIVTTVLLLLTLGFMVAAGFY